MKKIILLTIFSIFVLSSCWWDETENITEKEKKDFNIDVVEYSKLNNTTFLEKTWKLDSTQDISLTSQANGRVSKIYVKDWDSVYKWQTLALLEDNIANYGLNLEIAENNLKKAKLNYESTKVKLDKAISDIQRDLNNTKIDNVDSSSSLELEKIENSIKKLGLDYENLKISNLEQISAFKNSLSKDSDTLETYMEDVIDFSDSLLWVTNENRDKNDGYEDYLWAKDKTQLRNTEQLLLKLIDFKNTELVKVNFDFEWTTDFDSNTKIIKEWYEKINKLLTELKEVLDNSIESYWSLSTSQISSFKSVISGYESSYSMNYWAFVSLNNSVKSFLETFRNSENSLLKQIELLEQDKKIYIKWLDIKLDVTESTLEEAITNKDLTLKNLEVLITDAEIGYKQALKQFEKLYIKSPINWIISSVNIDVWQEINIWTPAFTLVSESNNEVVISFNKDELDYVKEGDMVIFDNWEEQFTGYLYSIASNADSNLKYISRVRFATKVDNIWNILTLNIPIEIDNKLAPLNSVKINNSWIWTFNIFSSWSILQKELKVWDIYWDKIEVLDIPEEDIKIITNYVDNFDPEKFNLKINEK